MDEPSAEWHRTDLAQAILQLIRGWKTRRPASGVGVSVVAKAPVLTETEVCRHEGMLNPELLGKLSPELGD